MMQLVNRYKRENIWIEVYETSSGYFIEDEIEIEEESE